MKRVIVLLWACLSSTLLLANHWTPDNPGAYAYVMGVTSVVEINTVEQTSDQLEVGAFCGTQCRGSQMASLFSHTGRYLAMITVYGDVGDEISFRLYDHSTGQEVDGVSLTTVTFSQDGYGTPLQPITLGFYSNLNINVTATPANGGTVTGSGSYLYGSQHTITATPATGYDFVNWTKNGQQVSSRNTYTFTVSEAAEYVAHFQIQSFQINVTANPANTGTVEGAGTYEYGSECTLTATPAEGYVFVTWLRNGSSVSNDASYTFTVTEAATYVARFAQEGYIESHWTPVSEPFQFYMALTAVVKIDGVEQTSDWLEVGAFCGEQCRGSQIMQEFYLTGRYLAMINVFGEEGDAFTFRLYDHSIDQEVDATCLTTVNFTMDDLGTPLEPYVLEFSAATTMTQTIALAEGENWVSFSVETTLDDLKAALVTALNNASGIKITSQSNGYTNWNGSTWRGSLYPFDVSQMYVIDVPRACRITLTAMPIDPTEHPITIVNGTNWIGFPFSVNMTLNDAFAGIAVSGDKVYSKSGYATYSGSRWNGGLTNLQPGQGYKYKMTTTEPRTLVFPSIRK